MDTAASGPQDPSVLRHECVEITDMLDHMMAEHDIEVAVGERPLIRTRRRPNA